MWPFDGKDPALLTPEEKLAVDEQAAGQIVDGSTVQPSQIVDGSVVQPGHVDGSVA